MSVGSPPTPMNNWVVSLGNKVPRQDGLAEQLNDLVGAKTWIMHPKRQMQRQMAPGYSKNDRITPKMRSRLESIDQMAGWVAPIIDRRPNALPTKYSKPD